MSLISIRSLRFKWPENRSLVLGIEELDLSAGEHLFLKGPSGCGKSTLLSILAGVVDVPSNSVSILNQDMSQLRKAQRDRFRVDHMGLIFQVFNLMPWLNAYENVLLPCRFSKRRKARAGADPTQTATRLMAEMGLDDPHLLNAPAGELSIGQQQRVAAARAVIGTPEIILADEPTSALDDETRDLFLTLLQKECRAAGSALVFVSHDQRLEQHFDRSIDLAKINNAEPAPC